MTPIAPVAPVAPELTAVISPPAPDPVVRPLPALPAVQTYVVVANDSSMKLWCYGPFKTARAAEVWARQQNEVPGHRHYLALPMTPRDWAEPTEHALALAELREIAEHRRA